MAHALTILGLLILVPAMVAVVFVISGLTFDPAMSATGIAIMAACFVGPWSAIPLWHLGNGDR